MGEISFGNNVLSSSGLGATYQWGENSAKLFFTYHDPQSQRTYLKIGDVTTLIGSEDNTPSYLASMDVNWSDWLTIVVAQDRKISFYRDGQPYNPAYSAVVAQWTGTDSVIAPSSVIKRSNGAVLITPVGDGTSWTLDVREINQSVGPNWQGWYGNGQNTLCHFFRSNFPEPCLEPDTVYITLSPSDPYFPEKIILHFHVCGNLDWDIAGYNIWYSDEPYGEFDFYTFWSNPNREADLPIPLAGLGERSFFRATVVYQVPDGSSLWGSHYLE